MTDRTVAKFSSADDLGSKVSRALNRAIRKTPGVGWIRGDSVSVEAESEILRLRAELAESREKSQTLKAATTDTGGAAGLSSGDDSIDITLNASSQVYGDDTHVQCQSRVTWNDILRTVGPSMIDEATEEYAEEKLAVCAYYGEISDDDFEALKSVPRRRLWLFDAEVEQVFVHLRTLGIIESGNKRRPVSDRRKYLRLTELGRATLEALMAVKKETDDSSDKGDSAATADGDGAQ
ncbi:hypothetical protein MTP03_10500 [Tsukamurella sp. PLM1]|nr:hypothetical protein MTP03_10500 [Tsukamurella sp. PLM1]